MQKIEVKKPTRISHTYKQTINGTINEIMPLYCPVRELDWIENWNPKAVYSESRFVEKDCIFITSNGENEIVWIVTDYNMENGHVEMYYHIPEVLITKLEIQLIPLKADTTRATITYTKTAINEMGIQELNKFTKEAYEVTMDSWEKAMNYYLATGEILTNLPNF